MQPHYFIGIALPADLSNKIISVQNKFYDESLLLKPLLPHITLINPNALTQISPMFLIPKIREITKELNLIIKLKDLSVFNDNVLYICVESPELERLHNSLVNLLPDDIVAKHFVSRQFVPHVTIAQTKPKIKLPSVLIDNYKNNIKSELPYSFNINSLYKFNRQYSRNYSVSKISDSSK